MLIKWSKPNVNQIKQSKQNSQAQKKKTQKKTQTNELTFIQRKETCKLKNQKKKWIDPNTQLQMIDYRSEHSNREGQLIMAPHWW